MDTQQIPLFDTLIAIRTNKRIDAIREKSRNIISEYDAAIKAEPGERPHIHAPADIAAIMIPIVLPETAQEHLWILTLDTRNGLKSITDLYTGTINQSNVRAAEVFRAAIIDSAASIILVHNHPSGDPSPSPDDVAVTRNIVQAGKLLDIDVLDHLVIGAGTGKYVSLKERGLGF